jgi:hypothetical protein
VVQFFRPGVGTCASFQMDMQTLECGKGPMRMALPDWRHRLMIPEGERSNVREQPRPTPYRILNFDVGPLV